MKKDVVIYGAGVVGITTAYFAHKAGHNVWIIDRHQYPCQETSHANGGQVSVCNSEVWNSWSNIFKGLKWMASKDAPLLINPKPSWQKYSWFLKFMTNINDFERNTQDTVSLAVRSRDLLDRIIFDMALPISKSENGIMHIYRSSKALEHARYVNELYKATRLPTMQRRKEYTAQELQRIEPNLDTEAMQDVIGGFYYADDWTGDCNAYCRQLLFRLMKDGVKFNETIPKDAVKIYCTGVSQYSFLAKDYDIYPVKGYSVTFEDCYRDHLDIGSVTNRVDTTVLPKTSILDDENKIVCSAYGDQFRVAGTAEFNGYNKDIRMDRIQPLVKWTEKHFPRVPTSRSLPWAGLRPMRPNMLPIVERRDDGSIVNLGHGHLGWTLSAVTAEMAVDLI